MKDVAAWKHRSQQASKTSGTHVLQCVCYSFCKVAVVAIATIVIAIEGIPFVVGFALVGATAAPLRVKC